MKRADLLAKLKALRPWLEAEGAVRVRVFGSHARDAAGPNSDVDLVVDFAATPSLLELVRIEQALSERLGARVDLATTAGLRPRVRAHVEAEAVDA